MEPIDDLIRRETEAARLLLRGIRETIGEEDMALLADTIEGETNLLEAIDTALAEIDESEVLIAGLKEKESQFNKRRKAMEDRVRRFRSLIEQAMAITEMLKLRRPGATLTLRKLAPDVLITSEAEIPSAFFVPQPPPPPKLDKTALREALQSREEQRRIAASLDGDQRAKALAAITPIPGAILDNGSLSLQIRRG